MFNFTVKLGADRSGEWCVVYTDAVVYYVAWYPEEKEPLGCSIWGHYGL